MTNNEMVMVNENGEILNNGIEAVQTIEQELATGGKDTFSSIALGGNISQLDLAIVSNAIASPDKRVADCVNMTLNVVDMIIHKVEITDEKTGERVIVPRVVLIDSDGVSYVAVSKGIYNVIRSNIFPLFGSPTWVEGLPLSVIQGGTGTRKFLTLNVDVKEMKKRAKDKK